MQGGWARCDPNGTGDFNWGWLDEAVLGAAAVGVKPWIELSYGNPAYVGGGGNGPGAGVPTSDAALAGWSRWVTAMATRYTGVVRCLGYVFVRSACRHSGSLPRQLSSKYRLNPTALADITTSPTSGRSGTSRSWDPTTTHHTLSWPLSHARPSTLALPPSLRGLGSFTAHSVAGTRACEPVLPSATTAVVSR
jgi:hypothetical protein